MQNNREKCLIQECGESCEETSHPSNAPVCTFLWGSTACGLGIEGAKYVATGAVSANFMPLVLGGFTCSTLWFFAQCCKSNKDAQREPLIPSVEHSPTIATASPSEGYNDVSVPFGSPPEEEMGFTPRNRYCDLPN